MTQKFVFVNRRSGKDRRDEEDIRKDLAIDIYYRERRKTKDRRARAKTLVDDYYDYMQKIVSASQRKQRSQKHPQK